MQLTSVDLNDVLDEGDALSKSAVETTAIMAEEGDKFACPSCKGKVFPAEKMSTSNGVVFHKKCFVCQVVPARVRYAGCPNILNGPLESGVSPDQTL